jgi:secreted Zn-dependent insulinase-like peptidase
MAHFLEHMMFQSTKSHPDGDFIPTLQGLGIGFSMHLNAYISFHETVYFLSLPNLANLATCFGWLRDVMDGALLEESEIEAERGVVVSELEYRDSFEARLQRELFQWMMPDHLVSKRFVIGTEETILGATKDMFAVFYQEYYVPRRATLIAVGDFNVSDSMSLMEDHFGTVKDSRDRGDLVDYGFSVGNGLRTNVFVTISLLRKGFIDMTCGHNICVTTAEKFKDFMYAGLCFLAILVLTKFQQLKEAWGRIAQALQVMQAQQPTNNKPKKE